MSNQRRGGIFHPYRLEYLTQRAWFARRARWFAEQAATGEPLLCVGCGRRETQSRLELHHLDYAGVHLNAGVWTAAEPYEDLMPMHRSCHELLHRLIDRDVVLSRHRTRRDATYLALERLGLRPQGSEGSA